MADDIASLGFAVDSAPLNQAAVALDRVSASAQKVGQSQSLALTQTARLTREQQLAERTARVTKVAQADLADKIELLSTNTREAYQSLSTRSFFRLLAREASLAGGPLAQLIGHVGILGVGGQRLGVGITAGVIAIAGLIASIYKAITAFATFESAQSQIGNALQLTRQASGQTADGLEKMARKLSDSGAVSIESVREAQAELLKFKNVGADAFEKVLEAAKALSVSGFTDMKTAAKTVAEALKDQGAATETLKAVGISLSVATQTQIDTFLRQGKVLEANRLIMEKIGEQTANLNQGTDDVSSAWTRFTNSLGDSLVVVGKRISDEIRLKDALDATTGALKRGAAANRERITGVTVLPGLPPGVESFSSRFNAEGIAEAAKNVTALDAAFKAVQKTMQDQGRTAGMNALELEQYNMTVLKGIPANDQFAASVRKMVAANMSLNETRTVSDAIKTQTAALRIESDTLEMAIGPAAAYRAEKEYLAQARIKGLEPTEKEIAAIRREAQALGEATAAAQQFRQLREFIRDSRDLNKQLDTLAVSGLNNVSTALVDVALGTKSVGDAFKSLSMSIARSILEMTIKMTVLLPLAQALKNALGGPVYGGGGAGDQGPTPAMLRHSGGLVDGSGPYRYIHPAYFDDAPRLHQGLMADEFPAILQRGETVVPRGGSPGGRVNVNVINNAGADVNIEERPSSNGIDLDIMIERKVNKTIASGSADRSLGGRMGAAPSVVRR